ncbi:MAG TPA: hypothetical protein DC047_16435 [Blastocatellia bacterium]|nr:hypothetical protein [Blastocatellia bacterium]
MLKDEGRCCWERGRLGRRRSAKRFLKKDQYQCSRSRVALIAGETPAVPAVAFSFHSVANQLAQAQVARVK